MGKQFNINQMVQNTTDFSFPVLKVKLTSATARVPMLGSANAAGYDMFASEATSVPAKGKTLIKTGVSMAIPIGNYGRIAPRSGLACKNFIDVGAGVIDADYRGEVRVLLFNFGETDFEVAEGDRIAQLIIEKYTQTELVEVTGDLDSTERGAGGFGSTGVKLSETKAQVEATLVG